MALVEKIKAEIKVEREQSALYKFQRFIRSKKFKRYKREVLGMNDQEDELERINNEEAYYHKMLTKNQKKFKKRFLEDIAINDKDVAEYLTNVENLDQKQNEENLNHSEGFFFRDSKIREFDDFTFNKLIRTKPYFKKKIAPQINRAFRRNLSMKPVNLSGARFKRTSLFVGVQPSNLNAASGANFEADLNPINEAKMVVKEKDEPKNEEVETDEEELTFSAFVFDYMKKID